MLSWLTRHFIPHEGNDHKPHFLHTENSRTLIAIVLLAELILFVLPTFNFVGIVRNSNLGEVLPVVLATLTNEERTQNNLPELTVNPLLSAAAQLKANDMATKGYFAHTSPEGKTPWYWFDQVGYRYEYAGENLAVNFTDSKDVTDAWMNSPTHRDNIVKANYKEMGTGIAVGVYKGRETIFVAQLYANPHVESPHEFAALIPTAEAAGVPAETKTAAKKSIPAPAAKTPSIVVSTNVKPTSDVLGATLDVSKNVSKSVTPTSSTPVGITQKEPSFFQEIIASPRHMVNAVLFVVAGIVILALLLMVVIKFDRRHPALITNGLLILAFIFGIYLVNAYISRDASFTTSYTSFDYKDR